MPSLAVSTILLYLSSDAFSSFSRLMRLEISWACPTALVTCPSQLRKGEAVNSNLPHVPLDTGIEMSHNCTFDVLKTSLKRIAKSSLWSPPSSAWQSFPMMGPPLSLKSMEKDSFARSMRRLESHINMGSFKLWNNNSNEGG